MNCGAEFRVFFGGRRRAVYFSRGLCGFDEDYGGKEGKGKKEGSEKEGGATVEAIQM